MPTSPPYVEKRSVPERLRLMGEVFAPRAAWVLSGSLLGWGDPLAGRFDAVVFLTLAPQVRIERLQARERARYGAAIEPGGAREAAHREFLAWAEGYDDPAFDGRNRARHEAWLSTLACPVLRLDGALDPDEPVRRVLEWEPGTTG